MGTSIRRSSARITGTWISISSIDTARGRSSSISFTITGPMSRRIRGGRNSCASGNRGRSSSGGRATSSSRPKVAVLSEGSAQRRIALVELGTFRRGGLLPSSDRGRDDRLPCKASRAQARFVRRVERDGTEPLHRGAVHGKEMTMGHKFPEIAFTPGVQGCKSASASNHSGSTGFLPIAVPIGARTPFRMTGFDRSGPRG